MLKSDFFEGLKQASTDFVFGQAHFTFSLTNGSIRGQHIEVNGTHTDTSDIRVFCPITALAFANGHIYLEPVDACLAGKMLGLRSDTIELIMLASDYSYYPREIISAPDYIWEDTRNQLLEAIGLTDAKPKLYRSNAG